MTHELPPVTGHPLEYWMLTATGAARHQRMMRLNVPTALCDPTLQLRSSRLAQESNKPCERCVAMIRHGDFDTELTFARRGVFA
jgi:hypothetical protein